MCSHSFLEITSLLALNFVFSPSSPSVASILSFSILNVLWRCQEARVFPELVSYLSSSVDQSCGRSLTSLASVQCGVDVVLQEVRSVILGVSVRAVLEALAWEPCLCVLSGGHVL